MSPIFRQYSEELYEILVELIKEDKNISAFNITIELKKKENHNYAYIKSEIIRL